MELTELKPITYDQKIQACSKSFIRGSCSNNHIFAKEIVCGKEYCPECGKNESTAHKRRISRWWPKVMSMTKVGYLVITVPSELRDKFKDTYILSEFRKTVREILQGIGIDKGLMRYHYFGDCINCNGEGCWNCFQTGAGNIFKPHLNILFERGYMHPHILEDFKNKIKAKISEYFSKISGGEIFSINLYYDYAGNIKKIIHRLKYVTRSTFRIYIPDIAKLLYGYRTTQSFGKFGELVHTLSNEIPVDSLRLEKNICPHCLKKLIWKGTIDIKTIFRGNKIYLNNGYIQLLTDG